MGSNKGTGSRKRSTNASGKKSTARNKKAGSRNTVSNLVTVDDSIRDEAILLGILAVSILLYLALFNVLGGFSKAIGGFLYGVFGIISFIVPIVIFFSAAFYISNKGQSVAYIKVISAIILLFSLAAFVQLAFDGDYNAVKISDYYSHCSIDRKGGGLLGGAFAFLLAKAFGKIGTFVVLIVLIIICVILITEKSFFGGVKKGSETIYNSARDNSERVRENRRIRQIERAERAERQRAEEEEKKARRENVVKGVMLDTALKPALKSSDDMHEITYDHDGKEDDLFNDSGDNAKIDSDYVPGETYKDRFNDTNVKTSHSIEFDDDYVDGFNGKKKKAEAEDNIVKINNDSFELVNRDDGLTEIKPNSSVEKKETSFTGHAKEALSSSVNISTLNDPKPKKEAIQSSENDIREITSSAPKTSKPKFTGNQGGEYKFPPIDLLRAGKKNSNMESRGELEQTALRLQQVLKTFGVNVEMTDIAQGPTVTRYEMLPAVGTKVSKITGLADDIKLNMAAADVRIEAPIPGKAAVGIEIPNKENATVMFRDLIEHKNFKEASSKISFAVGKDLSGDTVVADIAKMPHMLIAGSTGSGKSVCINTLIMSIIYKATPDEVKLIMVDPKVVELSVYNGIPHLMIPVVTDPKKAAAALNWGVAEMTDRYNKFAEFGVRDLKGYNKKIEQLNLDDDEERPKKLPQIVIIVDELADLMMVASKEVEESICRLAQLARAAGIHLIIATQRPSVDVITGLIKANMPSRVAFAVSSGTDSRTILDMNGAEKLLGKGDMLFYPQGYPKPTRLQGAFISDDEISDIVDYLKAQAGETTYNEEVLNKVNSQAASTGSQGGMQGGGSASGSDYDDLFVQAAKLIIEQDKASIGQFQRKFKIGFNRAARIMDQLAEAGVVGEEEGTKPRKVLMSMEQFENALEQGEF